MNICCSHESHTSQENPGKFKIKPGTSCLTAGTSDCSYSVREDITYLPHPCTLPDSGITRFFLVVWKLKGNLRSLCNLFFCWSWRSTPHDTRRSSRDLHIKKRKLDFSLKKDDYTKAIEWNQLCPNLMWKILPSSDCVCIMLILNFAKKIRRKIKLRRWKPKCKHLHYEKASRIF